MENRMYGECDIIRSPRRDHLFNLLFESSYSKSLTCQDKESLKILAKKRLEEITIGLKENAPATELLEKLSEKVYHSIVSKENANFAVDFATTGSANCVTYSSVLICSLEKIGRYDVLSDIKSMFDGDHIWLFYDGESRMYINRSGHKSEKVLPLEALLAHSINNKACDLLEHAHIGEALRQTYNAEKVCSGIPQVSNTMAVCLTSIYMVSKDRKLLDVALKYEEQALKSDPKNERYLYGKRYILALMNGEKPLKGRNAPATIP